MFYPRLEAPVRTSPATLAPSSSATRSSSRCRCCTASRNRFLDGYLESGRDTSSAWRANRRMKSRSGRTPRARTRRVPTVPCTPPRTSGVPRHRLCIPWTCCEHQVLSKTSASAEARVAVVVSRFVPTSRSVVARDRQIMDWARTFSVPQKHPVANTHDSQCAGNFFTSVFRM